MTAIDSEFSRLGQAIDEAVRAVEADAGASPVLLAVVKEFERKFSKALPTLDGDAVAVREAVIEVEQAGDSAKAGAEADPGASESTKTAVLAAHEVICVFKVTM